MVLGWEQPDADWLLLRPQRDALIVFWQLVIG
jgi:hypothetical protein